MIAKLKLWAAIAGGVAVAVLVALFKGYSAGQAASEAKQAAKERRDVKTVTDERTKATAKSDADLNQEMDKWTRD